jgi:hypothetical protein
MHGHSPSNIYVPVHMKVEMTTKNMPEFYGSN